MPSSRRTKGTGGLYQRADGYWVATVELPPAPSGARRRKQIVRKRKTDVIEAQRAARLEFAKHGDIRTDTPHTGAWVADWIDAREKSGHLRPRTADTYRGYLRNHIKPDLGTVRLDKLTPSHIERMTARMVADGVSPTSAIQAQNILKGALKAAERRGYVARNVATLAEAPKKAKYRAAELSLAQLVAILRWADTQSTMTAARWGLALLAGLRQGEALGLTRQNVDLERRVLRIAWQLQRLDGPPAASLDAHHVTGKYWLTQPKSDKGIREVPIVDGLYSVLVRRLAAMPDDPWAFVVTSSTGGPLDPSRDARDWKVALAAVGAPVVRLHDARHTTGTLLRVAQVEPRIIQVILGHNSAAMTEHYSHLGSSEAALAMGKFQALIESAGE